jgi:hypothetical protein
VTVTRSTSTGARLGPCGAAALLAALALPAEARAAAPGPDDTLAKPPRPALPPAPPAEPLPWARSLDVGPDLAIVFRPTPGGDDAIHYAPAAGLGLHGRIALHRYLRFSAYFVSATHEVELPSSALGLGGDLAVDDAATYSFGARLQPTWPLSERLRLWASAGAGWGRVEVGRMSVIEPGKPSFEVRERGESFVELPLGLGGSYDLIPRWLAIDVELTSAFVIDQHEGAFGAAQAIDADGKKRAIGAFPAFDAAIVQTLGLSLIL